MRVSLALCSAILFLSAFDFPQAVPEVFGEAGFIDGDPPALQLVDGREQRKEDPAPALWNGMLTSSDPVPSRYAGPDDGFFEDFEGYSYGQYLNDSGKWNYHFTYDFGKATAIANPFSSLTLKCGMNVNPSTGPMDQGALLSPVLDIEKGRLELWMASSHVDPTDHTRTTVFLFGTDSGGPAYNTDRMLKVGFNYDRIAYQSSDWGYITGNALPEVWYHLEISFDCSVQKCDISVTDTSGNLLGRKTGVDLVNGFGSVRRIGLVTGPLVDYEASTSYWDDLLIESSDASIIETDDRGGSLFDPLSDLSRVSRLHNLTPMSTGGLVSRSAGTTLEDFESYSDGEGIVGKNGWRFHTSFNKGLVTADKTPPFSGATPTVLKQYCNEESYSSEILSKELFLTDETIDFWMASNYREPTDHTTTQFFLWGAYKDDPTLSERMLAIVYAYNEIRVNNGVYHTLISNIGTHTWYHIRIELDLAVKKVSVYGMDAEGTLLGSLIDISLEHDHTMCKMVALVAGKMTGGTYITSYWDDITITAGGLFGAGTVETVPFELPIGCEWTGLRVEKRQAGGSEVSLRILDASTMDDTGLSFDNLSSEIDISALNSLGVRSIVLNATLTPGLRDPAVLLGWGVEWERADGYRDSFLTSLRTSKLARTRLDIGSVRMMDGMYDGQVRSVPVPLPDRSLVPTLFLDTALVGPTSLKVRLEDPVNGTVIGTALSSGNGTYSFHSVASWANDVVLAMDLRTAIRGPLVRSWSFAGLPNRAPVVLGLECPAVVNRTAEVTVNTSLLDLDQPSDLLDVELFYLPAGGTSWSSEFVRAEGFVKAKGGWSFTFLPGRTCDVGHHSFKVRVTDEHGSVVERTFADAITVLNNRPGMPDVVLSPLAPVTDSIVRATVLNASIDAEEELLLYTFEWYVNGAFERRDENLTLTGVSELSGSRFMKRDTVRCEVFSHDGLDRSDRGVAEVEVLNSPPRMVDPPLKLIEYNEDEPDLDGFDLTRWVVDPDSDRISYTLEGYRDIEMSIDDEGVLWVETRKDWNGNETVTVSAADQESRTIFDLTVIIRPVNDIPVLDSIDYEGVQAFPVIGDVPTTFDELGMPAGWEQDRMVDIRFSEEKVVPIRVNARDVETQAMDYSIMTFTDLPFTIVQDASTAATITFIPEKDAFGEFWTRLGIDDGDGGSVSVWLLINLTNVNDLPTGLVLVPANGYATGEVGVNLTFSARVDDVDGDALVVTWSVGPEVMATGETVNIMWMVPGIYDLECKVGDGTGSVSLGFVKVNVTAKPDIHGNGGGGSDIEVMLVVIALVVLVLVLAVGGFFVMRSVRKAREEEGRVSAPEGIELPALSPGATGADGQMVALGLAAPSLTGTLPPAGASMIRPPLDQGAPVEPVVAGELPPASIDMVVQQTGDLYIRPQSAPPRPSVGPGMMSAPIVSTQPVPPPEPVQAVQAELAPVPDVQDDMMKVGLSDGQPSAEGSVFHDEGEHVWTPAMAESRVAAEAKGAVDILRELNELKEKGAISDEEFDISKRRLLRKI